MLLGKKPQSEFADEKPVDLRQMQPEQVSPHNNQYQQYQQQPQQYLFNQNQNQPQQQFQQNLNQNQNQPERVRSA